MEIGISPSWKAITAAEPNCNAFPKPKRVNYPILILKDGESHYEPRSCEILPGLFGEEGTDLRIGIFPHSNHYFSHYCKIVDGNAFNFCDGNQVIIRRHGIFIFLNGTLRRSMRCGADVSLTKATAVKDKKVLITL